MVILVSGANGFIGGNIVTYLRENKSFKVEPLNLRVSLPNRFDADVIIHLAGKAHDLKNTSNANEYFEVNTELTKKVFETFLNSEANTFIYMSSVKAVADTVNGVLTEDAIPNPHTPYGASKLKAEEYLLSQQLPADKRLFILRPCMVHGPGNKGNLNLLYKIVKKGIPYPLAAFENSRSFLSIGNLNYIIGQIISDSTIAGGVYNMADDAPLSTNEVIGVIAQTSGVKPRLWKLAPGLIKALSVIGDKLKLPLNTERLTKLTESYVVLNEKIKKQLGVSELPISSTEGLKITIQSFTNERHK